MRYAMRLAEILGHTADRRKRPGTIKNIVEESGMDRHQVASLLKNEAKYVPIEAISRICDYLIEHGYATADQLPGALFAIKPENFWELLSRRRSLEICMGVRVGEKELPESAWVVASDAVLMGALINGISTLGGTTKHTAPSPGQPAPPSAAPPHPLRMVQTLVWSPGQVADEVCHKRAKKCFTSFSNAHGDKALVCIGSMKSNPVVEYMIAEAFETDPFQSQDDVEYASQRKVPFFLRYRDTDPHPPSMAAGMRLSKNEPADKPGVYYELADGTWTYAGGGENEHTALVFYIYREPLGRLDMAFCGFSGRATRWLARTLSNQAEGFWPPIYCEPSFEIGAFIVQYDPKESGDLLKTNLTVPPQITRLPAEAISRRLSDGLPPQQDPPLEDLEDLDDEEE
jgi:hypothetical protein